MFLLHIPCWLRFLMWWVSLTHPVLVSFLIGGVLLHIPCCLHFYLESFSCKHIRCWLHFYLWSFSYTSHVAFMFYLGSCVGHFSSGEFLLHISCWVHFFFLISRVSLTHPMLGSLLSGEFQLSQIPCWLYFSVGSFSYISHAGIFVLFFNLGSSSYTSRAGFIFIWGVSLKHLVLASFLCGEFLLHIIKN